MSAAFSAIITVEAAVCLPGIVGITDAPGDPQVADPEDVQW